MVHKITYWDLEFERVPLRFRSECGVPQIKLTPVGMPLIPRSVIDGVFYLYASSRDASEGRDAGGTGFIVAFEPMGPDGPRGPVYYGVTNHHVACDGFPVIRLNTRDGGTDIVDLNPDQWVFIPGKYDIAVAPLALDEKVHDVSAVSTREFASEPDRTWQNVGVGDDVFMIGLFADHDGAKVNVPSARFGNISMLPNPNATIKQPTGYNGVSYVIDMHSRTGFSGSPVYVYRTFGSDLTKFWGHEFEELELQDWGSRTGRGGHFGSPSRFRGRLRARNLFALLGIHWGQFPETWELRDKARLRESRKKHLITEGSYVEGMSGMTCVIPAWHILEVLEMPDLKKLRNYGATARSSGSVAPKPEASRQSNDENPTHREDFNSLLNAAVKKPAQED